MFGTLHVVRKSSNRPNLAFKVEILTDNQPIDARVLEYVQQNCVPHRLSTIIYVRTIKHVAYLVDTLNKLDPASNGPNLAVGYHGKMEKPDREENQRVFMGNQSLIMVVTSSFGMDVDKNDVRCVTNCGASYSGLESLQMLGRGGRDGQKALALTFTNEEDMEQAPIPSSHSFSNAVIKTLWPSPAHPAARTVFYRALLKCIPYKSYLHSLGGVESYFCPWCAHGTDSLRHFLVDCPVKWQLWQSVLSRYYSGYHLTSEIIYGTVRFPLLPRFIIDRTKYFAVISTRLW